MSPHELHINDPNFSTHYTGMKVVGTNMLGRMMPLVSKGLLSLDQVDTSSHEPLAPR